MSYRSTRGNNASNSPNLYSRRISRRNEGNNDSYSNQPAYSTQSGYQGATPNQQYNPGYNKQQAQAAAAVKQEFENLQQLKRDEAPQTPTKAMTKAPIKTSPATPAVQPPVPTASIPVPAEDEDDKMDDKPWKKKNFQKLPKKIRKKRLNAKLRNLLTPKNAMMVLHELHPSLSCTINEETANTGQLSYAVIIEIEGKQFKGQGLSKATAKQNACENALKAALYEKMTQANTVKAEEPMDTAESTDMNGEGAEAKPKKPPAEDDVPWGSLASYALFKLFSEWQSQGYSMPTTPGKPLQNPAAGPQLLMPMKKIPDDASDRHPVQLLNQLKPQCHYHETRDGNPPNMVFTYTVVMDSNTFTGSGPNKKEAKKTCAKNALISLGIQYAE